MTACLKCGHDPLAEVTGAWAWHIGREVQSGNMRIVNAGAARWTYAKARDAWQYEMRAARLATQMPKATGKRRVTFTRRFGSRQRAFDRDNLAAGLKACVDAMVREGLLLNDDAASAEIHYAQERMEPRGLYVHVEALS